MWLLWLYNYKSAKNRCLAGLCLSFVNWYGIDAMFGLFPFACDAGLSTCVLPLVVVLCLLSLLGFILLIMHMLPGIVL